MEDFIKAFKEMVESDISHDRATLAMIPRVMMSKAVAALKRYEQEQASKAKLHDGINVDNR